jgi:hypothetical protein
MPDPAHLIVHPPFTDDASERCGLPTKRSLHAQLDADLYLAWLSDWRRSVRSFGCVWMREPVCDG